MTRKPLVLATLAVTTAAAAAQDPVPRNLRCLVQSRDEALPARLEAKQSRWFAPLLVERIELEGATDAPGITVTARAGESVWRFDFADGIWRLELDRAQREAWQLTGKFLIEARRGGVALARFAGVAIPSQLELENRREQFTLVQRQSCELPGSSGYYKVRIDDITGGQTLLELRGARGETPIARRSVRAGEPLRFTVGSQSYVLVIASLVNRLIGDDHAVLAVSLAAHYESDRIQGLIARVAQAEVTFEREGKDYTAAQAAEHLRTKLHAAAAAELTLETFLTRIASRSSTTGNPYFIRLPDGTRVEAEVWLRAAAAAMAADAPATTRPSAR